MEKGDHSKLLFVINPVSGGKVKTDWEESIRAYFKPLPQAIEFYLLTGKDDKASVKHYIDTLKPAKVIGVGGDGTIKMIAELVKETDTILGIVPAGSANGMAKELDIPDDVNKALDIIVQGAPKAIDLIKINDKEICLHLSDIGLNARLVKYFEKSDGRGMWGYGKAVLKVLWSKQLMYATIKTDQETVKRKAYMVAIANATKYGTGAVINPEGNIADGLLEVVIIRKLKVLELLKMLLSYKAFNKDCIEVFHTKNLDIATLKEAHFQVDGEYRHKIKNIQAFIMPKSLQVMVPVQSVKENKA